MKINDYRTNLQRYRNYTKLQSGIDFVNEQLQTLGQKKVSELQKKKNPPLYHAKKEFEELVGTEFNELLNNSDDVFIKPGILMIDTPLLGFDENEDGIQGATLKNRLYQYFINHKGEGQVIIVDNLNVMPDIDLQDAGAKVTTYHKDRKTVTFTDLCQAGGKTSQRRQNETFI